MKALVCDFCNSVRFGVKMGYKTFKKEFDESRMIREFAKHKEFVGTDSPEDISFKKKINEIRGAAQKNYVPVKESKEYYNPVDGVQTAYREMEK